MTSSKAFQLVAMSAPPRNSYLAAHKRAERELWKMAQEYQAEAVKLDNGRMSDLGNPPEARGLGQTVSLWQR
jgi:hypothetical protein